MTGSPRVDQDRRPPTAGAETRESIRRAAEQLFRDEGYRGTSMRELARAVNIEAASIYNHFPSKSALLAHVMHSTMDELLQRIEQELQPIPADDPESRLLTAVRTYVRFHEDRLDAASITEAERRQLRQEDATKLFQQRRELRNQFRQVIDSGVDQRIFSCVDTSIATLSILSICARIPVWYRPSGRLTLDEIADELASIALAIAKQSG